MMVTRTGQEKGRQTSTWSDILISPWLTDVLFSLLALHLILTRS